MVPIGMCSVCTALQDGRATGLLEARFGAAFPLRLQRVINPEIAQERKRQRRTTLEIIRSNCTLRTTNDPSWPSVDRQAYA